MSSPILGIITEVISIIESLLNKAQTAPDGKVSADEVQSALDQARGKADAAHRAAGH